MTFIGYDCEQYGMLGSHIIGIGDHVNKGTDWKIRKHRSEYKSNLGKNLKDIE